MAKTGVVPMPGANEELLGGFTLWPRNPTLANYITIFTDPSWRDRIIHIYSFSKAYCVAGHRVGAMVTMAPGWREVGETASCKAMDNRVALYLFKDKSCVVENFNDEEVAVVLNGKKLTVPARGWQCYWR